MRISPGSWFPEPCCRLVPHGGRACAHPRGDCGRPPSQPCQGRHLCLALTVGNGEPLDMDLGVVLPCQNWGLAGVVCPALRKELCDGPMVCCVLESFKHNLHVQIHDVIFEVVLPLHYDILNICSLCDCVPSRYHRPPVSTTSDWERSFLNTRVGSGGFPHARNKLMRLN